MARWSLAVDGGSCVGSGVCTSIAPDHFRLDGDTSEPVSASVEPDEAVVDAAESCPVEAILVRDADGAQIAPQL